MEVCHREGRIDEEGVAGSLMGNMEWLRELKVRTMFGYKEAVWKSLRENQIEKLHLVFGGEGYLGEKHLQQLLEGFRAGWKLRHFGLEFENNQVFGQKFCLSLAQMGVYLGWLESLTFKAELRLNMIEAFFGCLESDAMRRMNLVIEIANNEDLDEIT